MHLTKRILKILMIYNGITQYDNYQTTYRKNKTQQTKQIFSPMFQSVSRRLSY